MHSQAAKTKMAASRCRLTGHQWTGVPTLVLTPTLVSFQGSTTLKERLVKAFSH